MSSKIIISAEASCDLPKELVEKYDVRIMPATVIVGDDILHDGEIEGEDLFRYFETTGKLPRTSATNVNEFDAYFGKLLEEADHVIHFSISGGISATCGNGAKSAQGMSEKTGKEVLSFDTRSLSTGMALQVLYAARLRDTGKYTAREIYDMVMARRPYAETSFATESVNYLAAGGRCPSVLALAANVLKLRPQIVMKEGKLQSAKKYRGKMSKWVPELIKDTLEENPDADKEICFLTYSSAEEDVLEAAEKQLYEFGFRKVVRALAGATICSHCGPHTLGVLYYSDGEHPVE